MTESWIISNLIARKYLYSQFHFIAAQGIIGENQENVEEFSE